MDTVHDDGERKARWTTRGNEQLFDGNEDFFSATPAMMHLEIMMVDAALKGHAEAVSAFLGLRRCGTRTVRKFSRRPAHGTVSLRRTCLLSIRLLWKYEGREAHR